MNTTENNKMLQGFGPTNKAERKDYNVKIVSFYQDVFKEVLERSRSHKKDQLAILSNTREVDLFHKGTIEAITAFEKFFTMAENELAADSINNFEEE